MAVSTYVDRYRTWRFDAYAWRQELSMPKKVALALGMACITGLLAQVRIPLGFTPVPIVGSNLGALAGGIALGPWYGALSILFYLALGACGVPWFQGHEGGLQYLLHSPTLGYLCGFLVAVFLVGRFTEKHLSLRGFWGQVWLLSTGMMIILALGALYLGVAFHMTFGEAMARGVMPFLVGDLLKAGLAAAVATTLLPKEMDRGGRA